VIIYKINGKKVTKKQWDARKGAGLRGGCPMGTVAYSESKPLVSDGVGCLKSQVPKLRESVKRHGIVGARVLDNGQVEFTSRRARRNLLRVRGLVDNEGGYSDG
jgi:hypothetical protein